MKELSVFIDESGDFGDVKERPAKEAVDKVSLSGKLARRLI